MDVAMVPILNDSFGYGLFYLSDQSYNNNFF